MYHFFIQIFNIIIVFNATLLYIYVESGEYKNRANILSSQSNNFFIAKMIWQARPLVIYETARSNLSSQSCIRIKGRLKKKKWHPSRGRAKFSAARKLTLFFFSRWKDRAHVHAYDVDVCECTYKYLSADISWCVHAATPSTHDTRARARARVRHIFFSPVSRVNFTTGLQRRKKKSYFTFFFLFVALHTLPHKFVFASQPRHNFVLRKFAAHLWKIIRSSSKIVYVARFRGSCRVAICPFFPALMHFRQNLFASGRWHLSLSLDRRHHDLHVPDKKLRIVEIAPRCSRWWLLSVEGDIFRRFV